MQTLEALRSGQISNVAKLKLEEGLSSFPEEIYALADTLETLDLSNNQLNELPDDFHRLNKLKVLFLSNNPFREFPKVLSRCENLEMVGFKSCLIDSIPENAFPARLRWLILTDNAITQVPESIGALPRLQKLMLAGNKLQSLPDSLSQCRNLELLRISANELTRLPNPVLSLPNLSWLAFAGNPFSSRDICEARDELPEVGLSSLNIAEVLGQGASGIIRRATWFGVSGERANRDDVAVKLFKGAVTSDGYPQDELAASVSVGKHPNLVEVLAKVSEGEQQGVVMSLIPSDFVNFGLPPTLESCTRDHFSSEMTLEIGDVLSIASSMASTVQHLHNRGVCHGDLYAHNMLINPLREVLFSDFGAASSLSCLSAAERALVQAMEVRAYGCLLDDLLGLLSGGGGSSVISGLCALRDDCMSPEIKCRPSFDNVCLRLENLSSL